jgi:hypothetical protein
MLFAIATAGSRLRSAAMALGSRLTGFLAVELVSVPACMRRPAAFGCDFPLTIRIHTGKTPVAALVLILVTALVVCHFSAPWKVATKWWQPLYCNGRASRGVAHSIKKSEENIAPECCFYSSILCYKKFNSLKIKKT